MDIKDKKEIQKMIAQQTSAFNNRLAKLEKEVRRSKIEIRNLKSVVQSLKKR